MSSEDEIAGPPETSADQPPGDSQAAPQRRFRRVILAAIVAVAAVAWISSQYFRKTNTPPSGTVFTIDGVSEEIAEVIAPAYDAVMKEPESAEKWGHLGMLLVAHQLESEGHACLAKAHALDPIEFQWPYLLAVTMTVYDPPRALAHMKTAVKLRGDVPVARIRLAELLIELDRLEEAEPHLQAALAVQPNNLRGLLASARLSLSRDDLDEGLAAANKAVEVAPGVRKTHELLAQILQRRGQRDEAIEHLAEAARLPVGAPPYDDPFEKKLHSLVNTTVMPKALRLLAEDRIQEALEVWEADGCDPAVAGRLADALAVSNDLEQADLVLTKAARMHPSSAQVHFQRGFLFYLQGNLPVAISAFQEAIERKPDFGMAYFLLGDSLEGQGRNEEALSAFESAAILLPDHEPSQASRARLLHDQERRKDAEQ